MTILARSKTIRLVKCPIQKQRFETGLYKHYSMGLAGEARGVCFGGGLVLGGFVLGKCVAARYNGSV